jgi:hypothetical protein
VARHVEDGLEQLVGEIVRTTHQRAEGRAPRPAVVSPEPGGGCAHGSFEHRGRAAVERMRERRVGMDELDAPGGEIDRPEERRRRGQGHDRGARIVPEAGQGQLGRAQSAAGGVGGLEHADGPPGPGERDGRGQPVRARPDDDRVDRAVAGPGARLLARHDRVVTVALRRERGPRHQGMASGFPGRAASAC